MATVIDQLLVELNLDGSKFAKGAQQAQASQKAIGTAATAMGKDMEAAARVAIAGLNRLRNEALALFAVITAGREVKQLTGDMLQTDAAAGRVAQNLGIATAELRAFQLAGERSGGTAAGVTASLQGMVSKLEQFKLTGQGADEMLGPLQRMGITLRDAAGGWKSNTDLFAEMNAWAQTRPRLEANQVLANFGLDEGTRNWVLSTTADFNKKLADAFRLELPSEQWVKFGQDLGNVYSRLQQRSDTFFRRVLEPSAPGVMRVLERLEDVLDRLGNRWADTIGQDLAGLVESFSRWLDSFTDADWDKLVKDIEGVGTSIMDVLRYIRNWSPPEWMRGLLGLPPAQPAAPGSGTSIPTPLGPITVEPSPTGRTGWGRLFGNFWTLPWNMQNSRPPVPAAPGGGTAAPPAAAPEAEGWWAWTKRKLGIGGAAAAPAAAPGVLPGGVTPAAYTGADALPKPVLDLIGKGEGTDAKRGYNETLAYGHWTGGDVNLTGMTLGQIDKLQDEMFRRQAAEGIGKDKWSSALGRYQFTQTTLRDLKEHYHLSDNTLFDPATQDMLAALRVKRAGGLTADNLARIWASFPTTRTGSSYYGQRTGVSLAEVEQALGGARIAAATSSPLSPVQQWLQQERARFERVSAGAAAVNSSIPTSSAAFRSNGPITTSTDNSRSSETHVNGPVNIYTQATDAQGIWRDFGGRLGSMDATDQRRGVA